MTLPIPLPQQAANSVENTYSNYLGQELSRYRQRYNAIFNVSLVDNSTSPPTPAAPVAASDIIAALGTNAAAVLTQLTAHYGYVNTIASSSLTTNDAIPTYTANSDGTVTLS